MAYLWSYIRTRCDWIVLATMQSGRKPPWRAMQNGSTSNTKANRSGGSSASTPSSRNTNLPVTQTLWIPQQTGPECNRQKPNQKKNMSEYMRKETPIEKDLWDEDHPSPQELGS